MVEVHTAAALVHYLKQPGATAAVCDARSKSAHIAGDDLDDIDALVHGIDDLNPVVLRRCVALMLESSSPLLRQRILEATVHEYREHLGRSGVESNAAERERLEALHQALLSRPRGAEPRDTVIANDVAALRSVLGTGRLGPTASRFGKDMLAEVDLVAGTYEGKPLTPAVVDALFSKGDETMLFRVANHAKSDDLRKAARRSIVKLHVRASKCPEVSSHAAEVEARVFATGRNTVELQETPPESGWIDDAKVGFRGIRVRQDVWNQVASLLPLDTKKTVLPSVTLRGALFVRVPGYSDPLTVCAHPEALDVTPCIDAHSVRPRLPILTVDDQGLLHVVERIATSDALKLVYNTENVPIPVDVGGKAVIMLEWPIHFDAPEPIVFEGPQSSRGPDIRVSIERRYSARLLFEVDGPNGKLRGVVENDDFSHMAIVTRGGAGQNGARGTDGSAGSAGSAGLGASCPGSPGSSGGRGGNGGNGTAGGPGGPGGPGGDVFAQVACVNGNCESVAQAVRGIVRSEGGSGGVGGDGGRGGAGGAGGSGGSGTSCYDSVSKRSTYLSGGTSGASGTTGSPGARGANGAAGRPGRVDMRMSQAK